jgi:hypothetical protein
MSYAIFCIWAFLLLSLVGSGFLRFCFGGAWQEAGVWGAWRGRQASQTPHFCAAKLNCFFYGGLGDVMNF